MKKNEIRTGDINNKEIRTSMDNMFPMSTKGVASQSKYIKEKTAGVDPFSTMQGNAMKGGVDVHQTPARRIYDPAVTYTNVMSPKSIKQRNRYYRNYFDNDEFVAAILEIHAELPYSDFELELDDPLIHREFTTCVDDLKLVTGLPGRTLEYNKIGEIILHHPFDESTGRFKHCIALNPDFVEVTHTPYIDNGYIYELTPDNDLRRLINSTDPKDLVLKKKLPKEILNRVLTGQNIPLNNRDITHIARKASPYDARGRSILHRLLRLLQYEDKLREAQMTIADNFIYPLKMFLLGDKNVGWIPSKEHMEAFSAMLEQANFDPNFALIYHYGVDVKYVTVADKLMNLSNEWDEINKKKAIALGVPQSFISGESGYASANVGLQTQLARYRAIRDTFEHGHIMRLFRILAENNEWYARDKREIVGNFRVKRTAAEKAERLLIPEIIWHKKLMMRDDQSYLAFLSNVYNQGKGPVSTITLLRAMGLDAKEELKRKKQQGKFEAQIGEKLTQSVTPGQGANNNNAAGQIQSSFMAKLSKFIPFSGKKDEFAEFKKDLGITDNLYTGASVVDDQIDDFAKTAAIDDNSLNELLNSYKPVSHEVWSKNLKSPRVSADMHLAFLDLNAKVDVLNKKYSSSFKLSDEDIENIVSSYKRLFIVGKINAYQLIKNSAVSITVDDCLYDYADQVIISEFETWLSKYNSALNKENYLGMLRSIGNSALAYGQLRAYREYDISKVKLANVHDKRGLVYGVDEMLKYRNALGPLVSPKDEVIVFYPKIEYLKYSAVAEDGDILIENVNTYKTYTHKGFMIKDAPIEYVNDINLFLDATYKISSSMYKNIVFVDKITDLEVWEKKALAKLQEESMNSTADKAELYAQHKAQLSLEKFKQADSEMFFVDKKTLYISKRVDINDNMLISKLYMHTGVLTSDSVRSAIDKVFKPAICNLNSEEITKYIRTGAIEPFFDASDNVQGFKISEDGKKHDFVDEKVKLGKIWDSNGNAVYSDNRTPVDMFDERVLDWIEYPHLMNSTVKSLFDAVAGK